MSALKERPKLNKSDVRMRELATIAPEIQGVPVSLDILLIRQMLANPNMKHSCFDLGRQLRRASTCATDYNIKKAFKYLTENGVVETHPQNLFSLTQDFKELIAEVNIKNAKNRSKRQRLA